MQPFIVVPPAHFAAFHQAFNGEDKGAWEVCTQCGGRCELHKIGSLMPGEKEFIAGKLSLAVDTFAAHYLDQIVTQYGVVDVLKLKPGCPFLDDCFHCTLAHGLVKPVLCEIYPVVFEVRERVLADGTPAPFIEFSIDTIDCPMMHLDFTWGGRRVQNPQWTAHRSHFQTRGVELLQAVAAPVNWYQAVAEFDSENFDYQQLERVRGVPTNQCATLTLDQLMSCRIGHDL